MEERVIILIIMLSVVTRIVTGQSNSSDTPVLKKEITTKVYVLDDKTVKIEQEIWKFPESPGSFEQTLRKFSIIDVSGVKQFSHTFPADFAGKTGFQTQYEIGAYMISAPLKDALVIGYNFFPSAPGSGHQLQFFVWGHDSLVALSKPFDINGSFGKITRNKEALPAGKLAESKVILPTQHAAGYFYLKIPVIINLDDLDGNPYELRTAKDPETNLQIMATEAKRWPMGEKSREVVLYASAKGDKATAIGVDKNSSVKIGSAYGTASVDEAETGVWISYEVKRLKVTINGKTGFVEQKDFRKLGLAFFG